MNHIANARLIENKNIECYIEGQKNSLEADFLLLTQDAQTKVLQNFNATDITELLSDTNIPQLWALEMSIVYHLSANELTRRVWIIREKFRSLCGDEMYRHYYDGLPLSLQEATLKTDTPLEPHQQELLRDDTVSIARQLQRLAYIRICRSESINKRKRFVIQSTLLIMLTGFLVFYMLNSDVNTFIETDIGKNGAKFLLLIIGAGITGSALSMLQRIEKASNTQPAITDNIHDAMQITLSMSNWYITSLLVSGAVFALLVQFICVAQLVNVLDILPKMPNTPDLKLPENTPLLQQLILYPDNRADLAKLLLTCFLSGFGERLIPDILDSLIKKAELKAPK